MLSLSLLGSDELEFVDAAWEASGRVVDDDDDDVVGGAGSAACKALAAARKASMKIKTIP